MANQRIRFSAPAKRLDKSDVLRAISAAALTSELEPDDVAEMVSQAFDIYETELELAPVSRRSRETQRARLLAAIDRLQRVLGEPRSEDLLDMLATYRAGEELAAVISDRPAPPERFIGSVPRHALNQNLADLRVALMTRTWSEEEQAESTRTCSYYDALVGELAEVFAVAFGTNATASNRGAGTVDSAFERFARELLLRSKIQPVPSETTIGDALGDYRAWLLRT